MMLDAQYGVGVNNRYAMFIDEPDESLSSPSTDSLKRPDNDSQRKQRPVDKKPHGQSAAKSTEADKENNRKAPNQAKSFSDKDNIRRKDIRESGAPFKATGPVSDTSVHKRGGGQRFGDQGRGGGSRRQGGRVGGTSTENSSGPTHKRIYERHSGDDKTGVKHVDKREGGGSHNWGSINDEVQAAIDNEEKTAASANTSTDEEEATEQGAKSADGAGDKAEPEIEYLTWEEYKAKEAAQGRAHTKPTFNKRQPGEGSEFDPKWKKTYVYRKERTNSNNDDMDGQDEIHEPYPQRVNRQKQVTDLNFTFDQPRDRGGRRGGRRDGNTEGSGRGGMRGQHANRGNIVQKVNSGNQAPNVNDQASFPSLG